MADKKQEVKSAVVRFKLIFRENNKKDGGTFITMKTILKDGNDDKWIEVLFGDNVNTKLFKGKNQIIEAYASDVVLPRSLKPYTKDGKTKYPYVWVENIIKATPYEFKGTTEPKETTQSAFQMDEEDTEKVTYADEEMPFNK